MTVVPAFTWHDDITVNGTPYPTRHPAPHTNPNSDTYLGTLSNHQRDTLCAHHEAAHAIASLTAGGHIHHAEITPTAKTLTNITQMTGRVLGCNLYKGRDYATFYAAGERAEDHWLHQADLWTPTRAVGVELGALHDRRAFLAGSPNFGFHSDCDNYRLIHDLADELVIQHWDAITAVAQALMKRLHLTGRQVAAVAQMPNGTHSANCTFPA